MNVPAISLNNGVTMPLLGLGIYAPKQQNEVQQAVEDALEFGCRLLDTASIYGNETQVAQAVQASGLSREAVFITTKVWNDDQGYDQTRLAFDQSLAKLTVDYIDLYLIHWPNGADRLGTWRALESLYAEGRARAIGVSNFYPHHLNELLAVANIIPAVNQLEFSPYCYRPEVLDYCSGRGIQVEGYAPLVRGLKQHDPTLLHIAESHHKSTYQVLVRWSMQHGVVTIPKSVNRERIRHNFDVFDFELNTEDMVVLDSLYDNTRIAPDPDTLP